MPLQPPSDHMPLRPAASLPWLRFPLDHNPCFLLSALSMFLGCYLINSALDVRTGDVAKLFELLVAINLYEFSLLTVGISLLRRTPWNRDGVLLLVIQMLFLADGPFLLAETAMASAHWASYINAGLLVLAIVKATVAMGALRIPLRPRTLGFLALQLLLIYSALPIFFANVAVDGIIGAAPMCLAWWIVGMLPALYELLTKLDPLPPESTSHAVLRRAYIIVPWLLLIAHLGFFQYAYRAPFFAGDLSPIFLGLAITTLRLRSSAWLKQPDRLILQILLPAVAAVLGLVGTDVDLHWSAASSIILPPTAATIVAVFLTYPYFLSARIALVTAIFFGMFGCLHWFGLTREKLWNVGISVIDLVYTKLLSVLPSTPIAWGIFAILIAFALLGVGGFLTLRPKPNSV